MLIIKIVLPESLLVMVMAGVVGVMGMNVVLTNEGMCRDRLGLLRFEFSEEVPTLGGRTSCAEVGPVPSRVALRRTDHAVPPGFN